MKRRTWYCYRLEEKRSKCDKPYYGKTCNLVKRSRQWQKKLKLDYIPKLHIEYTDTSEQRVYDFEQEKRVANCWPRESSLRHQRKIRKKGTEASANSPKLKEHQSKAGRIGGLKTKESGALKIASSLGGKKSCSIQATCPHCGKTGQKLAMTIWHFDKCKLKPQQSRQSHQL